MQIIKITGNIEKKKQKGEIRMQNDKVLKVIDGYQIMAGKRSGKDTIFITSPEGVNFSLPIGLMYELVNLLENDSDFSRNFEF